MLLERKLVTTSGNFINISSDDPKINAHFTDPRNFTDVIIDQMNTQNIYGRWLQNKSNLNILDCGANVGLFALHVSDCAKKVVSVEPTPNHLYILKEMTKAYLNINVVEAALNYQDEDVAFHFHTSNTTMNSIINNYGEGSILVKGKTLKTILDENGLDTVDFAKIDIEGSELVALTAETIAATEKRIKAWFIETHGAGNIMYDVNRNHLAGLFNQAGYKIELIGHDTLHVYV